MGGCNDVPQRSLTAPARNASTRIFVRRAHGEVKFIISQLTDNIPQLKLAPVFAAGPSIKKAHFSPDMNSIGGVQIHDVIG